MTASRYTTASAIRPLKTLAPWLVVAVPAIILGLLVQQTSVNIPHWDDWAMIRLYLDAREGTWNPATLFDSHIEHRWALTRLLTLAFNFVSGADVRVQHVASVIFATLACGFCFLLIRRSVRLTTPALLTGLCTTLLILSPTQWQNWLWGLNFSYYIVILCLGVAIWYVARDRPPVPTFVVLALAALISTFSFSTGLATWPALFICVLALCARSRTWKPAVGWVLLTLPVYAFYFLFDPVNKANLSHTPLSDGTSGFEHTAALLREAPREFPGRATMFFLTLLGNPLCRGSLLRSQELAPAIGGMFLALSAFVLVKIFWVRKPMSRADEFVFFAPWLSLTAFGVLAAAFITIGRVGTYPTTGALFGRYVTFPSLAWVGLLGLAMALLTRRHPAAFERPKTMLATGLCAGVILSLLALNWQYGSRQMHYWSWGRRHGQAALRFSHLLPSVDLSLTEGDGAFARKQALRLHELGLLEYPLLDDLRLKNFKLSKRAMKERRGSIALVPGSPSGRRVHGVALMAGPERPADAILFVTRHTGVPTVFDLCRAEALSPHVRAIAGRDAEHMAQRRILSEEYGAYEHDLDIGLLPQGVHDVEAWVYSVEKNTVWRIPGSVQITKPAPGFESPQTRVPSD